MKLFRLYIPMILCFLLMNSSVVGATLQKIELRRVPPGWTSIESGYFFTEKALVEFAEAAFTYEATAIAWENAYWELDKKFKDTLIDFDGRLDSITKEHENSINDYKRELKKANARKYRPTLGFFIGGGYNGNTFDKTAGFGLIFPVGL